MHLTPNAPQYVDSDVDVLGTPILKDVINETIPDDVIDEELENILPDFISQLNTMYMCGNLGDPISARDTLEILERTKPKHVAKHEYKCWC